MAVRVVNDFIVCLLGGVVPLDGTREQRWSTNGVPGTHLFLAKKYPVADERQTAGESSRPSAQDRRN
jgi:hypothetical protein